MKKLFVIFASVALLLAGCGKEYDDSVLTGRVDGLENRVARLEELCKQMNTNISSLQTIVTALQNNDYVTAVTPVTRDGETVGYTISFTKSSPITIYHGQNGKDGINGSDGKDGVNGHTPIVGVRQDADGIYYWTLDGEWLLDNAGNKVKAEGRDGQNGADGKDGVNGSDGKDGVNGSDGQDGADGKDGSDGKDGKDGQNGADGKDGQDGRPGADGKDGVTPQLKIEDGCWYVSTDNGTTWTNLGKATGEDGKDGVDGDQFFQNVDTSNNEYIAFTLADGTMIKLPTWYAFEQLKTLCNQMNTNISSLQAIVTVLQNNDYVTSCTPLMENGKHIGYTVTFAKSNSIVIYHGKDGTNGSDGKGGHSPVIGTKTDTNGIIYWTLDGEWLADESGNRIPVHGSDGVNGSDGITPQFKIVEGCWNISYDGGSSWTQLGKATGENGKDGDLFFKSIDTSNNEYVVFTLADGTTIKLPTWHAFEQLRILCNQMNTNINAMQTIVTALQNNDYVKNITPVMQDGREIGYTIIFNKNNPVTIYHGQNGKDGTNGSDGKDGANGADGHTPIIGVRQDADGVYYWTLDGKWMLDNAGSKVKAEGRDGQNGADGQDGADGSDGKDGVNGSDGQDGSDGKDGQDGRPGADGKDGVTPQLKIEDGYWYVSTDNGTTWSNLGKATGEDGKDGADGNSIFRSVTQDEYNVYFTLANGEIITMSKSGANKLSIIFSCGDSLELQSGVGKTITYSIKGGTENNIVKAEVYYPIDDTQYQEITVTPSSADTGSISIMLGTTSGYIYTGTNKILVTVSNGETTIMTTINISVKR